MRKSSLFALACVSSVMLLVSGCGSSASSDYKSASRNSAEGAYATETAAEYDYGMYDTAAAAGEAEYSEEAYDGNGGSTGPQVEEQQNQNRKLITTVNLTAETEDLSETIISVENKVKELGGYIESSNVYNGSNSKYSTRDANLTIRIPASRLDEFVDSVEGNTNITRKSVTVDDVTLKYVDTESRKNSLKTEEKRLLDIMEKAETIEDIIAIEDKLADVRYELESIESQLRSYDNLVDYSTIILYVTEVAKYTPVEKESAFTRMGNGFMESVQSIADGFVELCVAFVSSIPQIIVFLLVVCIIVFIVKKIMDISKRNNAKKLAAGQAIMAAGYQNAQMVSPNGFKAPVQGQNQVNVQASQPVQNQKPDNEKKSGDANSEVK
ncbi:MAG: DUF4349 domain-containing protein [Butyrivibrio sp.]|nr:DUF4349 domain-containing protein [Butyrivibrio sp.]